MADNNWTEAEIETLKKLWATGITASALGRRLGKSRNSILSKVHRMKLTRTTGHGIDRAVKKPKQVQAAKRARKVLQRRPAMRPTVPRFDVPPIAPAPKLAPQLPARRAKPVVAHRRRSRLPEHYNDDKVFAKVVDELKPADESITNIPNVFQCKWIDGDVKSGHATWCRKVAVQGKPWCKKHIELIYQEPLPRRRYK